MNFCRATLERKEVSKSENYLVCTFSLEAGKNFSFLPGQYVWLKLPNLVKDDPAGNFRAFSVLSSPQELPRLEILMKISDSGYKHTCLNLEPGAQVTIEGPFGSAFILDPEVKKPIVLIGGGCGSSPFVSILRSLPASGNELIKVVILNSNQESACYDQELCRLAHSKNIDIYSIFGHFRNEELPDSLPFATADFYISGSPGLVTAINQVLLLRGVLKAHLHYEQYFPTTESALTEAYFTQNVARDNILLQAILDSTSHVIITDINGQIIFANPTAERNTGFTFSEMRSCTPRLWGGLMPLSLYQQMWQQIKMGNSFDGEFLNRRKNGERYTVIAHISPIFNPQRQIIGFIGTEEDITQRVKLEEGKTQFVSVASHQLRTPLGITQWYLEALQQTQYYQDAPADFKKYFNELVKSNSRILELVRDLLTVSRLEQGRSKNNPEQVNVQMLLKEIVSEMTILAQRKSIDFQLQLPVETDPVSILYLDAIRLREVYANLIANAFEFTPDDGKITVSLSVTPNQVIVSVQDTGIGIAPEDQNQLFQKFVRLKSAVQVNPNGTGLGLYIVKTTVEEWGGTVVLKSAVGQGSTFTVSLPLISAQPIINQQSSVGFDSITST